MCKCMQDVDGTGRHTAYVLVISDDWMRVRFEMHHFHLEEVFCVSGNSITLANRYRPASEDPEREFEDGETARVIDQS